MKKTLFTILGRRDQHTTETQENPEIDSDDEDDTQSTKYCCGIPGCFALWRVKPLKEGGKEKVLDMNLTVESLRFEWIFN